MKCYWNKISALLSKDMRDNLKNPQLMVMVLLPVVFVSIYRFMDFGGEHLGRDYLMLLGVVMTGVMVPISFLSTSIAEEKEKNTLRTLMLSNVTGGQFLLSKGLMALLLTLVVDTAVFFICNAPVKMLPAYLLCAAIGSLGLIFLGAVVGLLSKDQMSTGIVSAPLMILLLMPTVFSSMNSFFAAAAKFVPTTVLVDLLLLSTDGIALTEPVMLKNLLAALAWGVGLGVVCLVVYRRDRLDR